MHYELLLNYENNILENLLLLQRHLQNNVILNSQCKMVLRINNLSMGAF